MMKENARKIIASDKTVFAPGKWTPKREAYFKVYQELLITHPIESVLNIGVGPKLSALKWNIIIRNIWPAIKHFENLELDLSVVNKARGHGSPLISNVKQGDVKDITNIYDDDSFDLIYWNQGPEHIYRREWRECFEKLDRVAKKAIYMHCPWGSGYDGDKWHYSKNIKEGEFEQFGFECVYHGVENSRNAGIMSYKIL